MLTVTSSENVCKPDRTAAFVLTTSPLGVSSRHYALFVTSQRMPSRNKTPVRPCRRCKFTGHTVRMLSQVPDDEERRRSGEFDADVGESIIPTDVIKEAEKKATEDGKPDDIEDDEDIEEELHESWHIYTSGGNKCVICFGRGETRCLYCYGESTVKIGPDEARDTIPCPQCNGNGYETCRRCKGSGIRPSTRFDVNLWKYVPNVTNEDICNGPTWAEVEEARKKNPDREEAEPVGSDSEKEEVSGEAEHTPQSVNDQTPTTSPS